MRSLITFGLVISVAACGQSTGSGYTISTAAGSDWVGDGGVAVSAILFQAEGVAVDTNANL